MISKYPALDHAEKVVAALIKLLPKSERGKTHGIFLQGSPTLFRDDTDREMTFHQEANFNYLTGVIHPSCSVLITFNIPKHHHHHSHSHSHEQDHEHQHHQHQQHQESTKEPKIKHELFIPPADPEETMWSVPPPSLSEARTKFDSDHISHTSHLSTAIDRLSERSISSPLSSPSEGRPAIKLHTLPKIMEYPALPDFLAKHPGIELDDGYLFEALHRARLLKDEHEIAWIKEANRISSGAHEVVMRELGRFARQRQHPQEAQANATSEAGKVIEPRTGREVLSQWEIESEGDAEAVFVAACRRMGAINMAYLPIVGSGSRASTLHYVCNDRLFPSTSLPRKEGDTSFTPTQLSRGCCGAFIPEEKHEHLTPATQLHDESFEPQVLLIDAGCEWQGYAADITRTIPIGNGGKFTKEAGEIYELVLRMQKEAEAMVKPGVHWDTIHLHTHKVLVDGFIKLGIFEGDATKILESGVTAGFYPHGLGHSLGLDVHDSRQLLRSTNGHSSIPEESTKVPNLYKYLRIRRPLEEGMVLTIEPGCYFPPQLLDTHNVWTNQFVNQDVLKKYLAVGGVRIEDVVVVREAGVENLTTVGRERDWIERVCSGDVS